MFFTIRPFILTVIVFTPRPYCWRRANRSDNVFVAASIDAELTIWHLPYCIQHCTNKNNDSQLNVIFKNWTIAGVQFVWTSSLKGLCLLPQSYRLRRSFTSEGLCKDATIRSSIHTFLRMWLIIIYNSNDHTHTDYAHTSCTYGYKRHFISIKIKGISSFILCPENTSIIACNYHLETKKLPKQDQKSNKV